MLDELDILQDEITIEIPPTNIFLDAVTYTPQVLTSSQKQQARTNINAQELLVSGTNIKTINNQNVLGSGNITISALPEVTSADNGKILMVVNGQWTLVNSITASTESF